MGFNRGSDSTAVPRYVNAPPVVLALITLRCLFRPCLHLLRREPTSSTPPAAGRPMFTAVAWPLDPHHSLLCAFLFITAALPFDPACRWHAPK